MRLATLIAVPCLLVGAAHAAWTPYSSQKGHFSVQLPAKPQEQLMKTPFQGKEYTTYLYISAVKSQAGIISSTAVPGTQADAAQAIRSGYIGAFLKNAKANQTSRKPLNLHGYQGEVVTFSTPSAKGSMWVFLTHHRLYGVVALGADDAKVKSASNQLFNTFKAS